MKCVVATHKVFMMIKIIKNSKNAIMRCWTKSDFAITYHFGHISSISGPFLFKIGSKCAHFWGVLCGQPVQTDSVALFESMQLQPPVQS